MTSSREINKYSPLFTIIKYFVDHPGDALRQSHPWLQQQLLQHSQVSQKKQEKLSKNLRNSAWERAVRSVRRLPMFNKLKFMPGFESSNTSRTR
jgi:hypothetical protein